MHIWHFTLGGGSQLQLKVRGIALSSFSLFAVLLKLACQFNWLSLGMFRMFRDDAENRSLEACEESMRLSCWHSSWVIKGRTLDWMVGSIRGKCPKMQIYTHTFQETLVSWKCPLSLVFWSEFDKWKLENELIDTSFWSLLWVQEIGKWEIKLTVVGSTCFRIMPSWI